MKITENKKPLNIIVLTMMALFMTSQNAYANLPVPPWLNPASSPVWGAAPGKSGVAGQLVVKSRSGSNVSSLPPLLSFATGGGNRRTGLADIIADTIPESGWVQEFAALSRRHLILKSMDADGLIDAVGKSVPEPGVLFVLGSGLIGLLMVARRKSAFSGTGV